jgi:hypothetical protein
MVKMVNGRLMRVEPSGAWNQYVERGPHRYAAEATRICPSPTYYIGSKGCGRRAGGGGQGRAGKWVILSKGGKMVGKRTGLAHIAPAFSHLGPDESLQVVDFPHLTHVRLFWEALESGQANGTDTEDARNKARRGTPDRKEGYHIYASRYIDFYACNSDIRSYAA